MKTLILIIAILTSASISYSQIYENWTARFNQANGNDIAYGLKVNSSGNSFVTGTSFNSSTDAEAWTLKYNNCGDLIWSVGYSSGGFTPNAWAYDLLLHSSGYIYTTGEKYSSFINEQDLLTLKYNTSGTQQWVRSLGGAGYTAGQHIREDKDGNIIIASYNETYDNGFWDYNVTKYEEDGDLVWTYAFGEQYQDEIVEDMFIDENGYIYLTGGQDQGSGNYDIWTMKIEPDGDLVWDVTYAGDAGEGDGGKGIAVDGDGNVFVTGVSRNYEDPQNESSGIFNTFTTIKYSSSGTLAWIEKKLGTLTADKHSWGNDIILDNGYAYVTGWARYTTTTADILTIKYQMSNGTEIWDETYSYTNKEDLGRYIAKDDNGNVYISGRSKNTADPSNEYYDYVTIKYTTSGSQSWSMRYNGPDDFYDVPNDICVIDNDNVTVTGESTSSTGGKDYLTVRYSSGWPVCDPEDNPSGITYNKIHHSNDRVAIAGSSGKIKLSTDNGLTWSESTISSRDLTSVAFINNNTGFAAGDSGTFLYTLNGGSTWHTWDLNVIDKLNDISVSGNELIISSKKGRVLRYNTQTGSHNSSSLDTSQDLKSSAYLNNNTGFVTGNNGKLWKTTNNGQIWTSSTLANNITLNKVYFSSNNYGYIVGDNGTMFITTNSGSTWTEKNINQSVNLNDVFFTSVDTGYVCGNNGLILFTADKGNSWKVVETSTDDDLHSVTFKNGRGIAAGENKRIVLSSLGEKYSSQGGDAITGFQNDNILLNPDNYILSQNYPNPFNPTTTIKYYIPDLSIVELKVYDITGKTVTSLVSGTKRKGNYEVQFDGSSLSSGVYYYVLKAQKLNGDGMVVQLSNKMVLIK